MARHSGPRSAMRGGGRPRLPQKRAIATDQSSFPVVAIGASAGGLEAFRTLLAALPASSGMAFILVQHLDPTHASMLVDLLSPRTKMTVLEARQDLRLEPDHIMHHPAGTLSRSA